MKFTIKKIEKITGDCYRHEVSIEFSMGKVNGIICWSYPLKFNQVYNLKVEENNEQESNS